LGGSAPRLRSLTLDGTPFPGLPKLRLSAAHLVDLSIRRIPHSGYITPEALAAYLSALTALESFWLTFESPQSRPADENRRPPPRTRALLPALTELRFKGASDYLEPLVARIDAPRLDRFRITFIHRLIFDTSQLAQFIGRTPKFKALDEAHVAFSYSGVSVALSQNTSTRRLQVEIPCQQAGWQLSSLIHILPIISSFEHIYIYQRNYLRLYWQDDIENVQWLELLHLLAAVKDLYLSREFAPRIAAALQELTAESVTEVLPALQSLFLEELQPSGPVQEIIGRFVDARQHAGCPITHSRWERK